MTTPTSFNPGPLLDALKALGFNTADWAIKAGKSKTLWFSNALIVIGAIDFYMPSLKELIPVSWYGPIIGGIGLVTAILRVMTKDAITDK